jgi:hypothetical protein
MIEEDKKATEDFSQFPKVKLHEMINTEECVDDWVGIQKGNSPQKP